MLPAAILLRHTLHADAQGLLDGILFYNLLFGSKTFATKKRAGARLSFDT